MLLIMVWCLQSGARWNPWPSWSWRTPVIGRSHVVLGEGVLQFSLDSYLCKFRLRDSTESGATQNILQTSRAESINLGLVEIGGGRAYFVVTPTAGTVAAG